MSSIYLYLIGGLALLAAGLAAGFGGGFVLEQHLTMDKITQLSSDLGTARANNAVLDNGLKTCNASVTNAAQASKALTDAAQSLIDAAAKTGATLSANIAAAKAIKSDPAEKCPVAKTVLERAVQ